MFDLIKRMRAKPPAYRRALALWLSLGIMAIIVAVWALSFVTRVASLDDKTPDMPEAPGPFESIVEQIKAIL